MHTPDPQTLERIKENMERQRLVPSFYMASTASLNKVWGRYEEISMAEDSQIGGLDISPEVLRDTAKSIEKME